MSLEIMDLLGSVLDSNYITDSPEHSNSSTTPNYGWSIFADIDPQLREVNSIVSGVLGLAGLIFNTITLIVLLDRNLRGKKKYKLIVSLTIVDLLSCISAVFYANCNPNWSVPEGFLGQFLCKVIFSRFLYYVLSAVSAWHLVMISVERYVFVLHTDWYDHYFTTLLNTLLILLCWLIGIGTMSYDLVLFSRYHTTCQFKWPSDLAKTSSGVEEAVVMVLLPVVIMTVLYLRVYMRVREFNALFNAKSPTPQPTFGFLRQQTIRIDSNETRVSSLLLILVYIVCWAPNEILFAGYGLGLIGDDDSEEDDIFTRVPFYITQILINLSAVCNPILYACSFKEFRSLLKMKVKRSPQSILNFCCCRIGRASNSDAADSEIRVYRVTSLNDSANPNREQFYNDQSKISIPQDSQFDDYNDNYGRETDTGTLM